MNDPHERIRHRAHEIWEREGRPHGQHDEHWIRAEREVLAESGQDAETGTGTPTKHRSQAKGIRAAAETISTAASGAGKESAPPAKGTGRKAKTEAGEAAAPTPTKAEKPAKSARAGRKDTQGDGRKGAAPH